MGADRTLRLFDRAALQDMEDLALLGSADLYVLTEPDGALELYQSPHSELVIWAYSGVENLVESCGGGQPYVRATPDQIVGFAASIDMPMLLALDVWHPEGARYPEPDARDFEPLEPVDEYQPDLTVVWIPTLPVRVGDLEVGVELHCSTPGVPLLAAFTSVEALREGCGPFQAAAAVLLDRVGEVARQAGAHCVVFDPTLAESARYNAPVRDWTRRSHFG